MLFRGIRALGHALPKEKKASSLGISPKENHFLGYAVS